jgi:ABC-type antimicrobial peptide transport system permease subunit
VSVTIDMSEGELKLVVLKLGIFVAIIISLLGLLLTYLVDDGMHVAGTILLLCFPFVLVTNGLLATLTIIDWFAARKARNHG